MPGGFFRIMIHSQNPTHPPTCRTGVFVETVSLCPHQMRISAARERECITSYELFYNLCIHRHVLERRLLKSGMSYLCTLKIFLEVPGS